MKYVILIHSNPQPWGHPTSDYVSEHQALPAAQREALNKEFDDGFAELMSRGEFVTAEALADPSTSRLFCRGLWARYSRPSDVRRFPSSQSCSSAKVRQDSSIRL